VARLVLDLELRNAEHGSYSPVIPLGNPGAGSDLEIGKRGPGPVQEHDGVADLATGTIIIGVSPLDLTRMSQPCS
jgi:hypothetical protein